MLEPFLIEDHLRRLKEEKQRLERPQPALEVPRPTSPNETEDAPETVWVIELL